MFRPQRVLKNKCIISQHINGILIIISLLYLASHSNTCCYVWLSEVCCGSVDNAAKYVVCGCHVCGCHEQFLYQLYKVGISANPSTTSFPLTYQLSRTNILPSFYTFVTILVGNKYSRSQTSCWCCRGLSRRTLSETQGEDLCLIPTVGM